jgi:hypothetical protein
MAVKTEGVRALLGAVWREISSWGSGIDFSFYDHLQDRIDQLEQELARARRSPSEPLSELAMPQLAMPQLAMPQLDECW